MFRYQKKKIEENREERLNNNEKLLGIIMIKTNYFPQIWISG